MNTMSSLPWTRRRLFQAAATLAVGGWGAARPAFGASRAPRPPELLREFVYDEAEFPSCHACTLAETRRGLLAAWFGGTAEGRQDVSIYTARREAAGWSKPRKVAEGWGEAGVDRHPSWNPVLHQDRQGVLWLFYKIGPRPHSWWGVVRRSMDDGETWSEPHRLPDGLMGPVRAKPLELPDGTLLCGSSTEHAGWQVQMEWTRDPLGAWERTPPLNEAHEWGAIQPTLLDHGRGHLQILCRSRQKVILEATSTDWGRTWTPLTATVLPNPNSGIDAVGLGSRGFLLVYNHLAQGRGTLNLALSRDGHAWESAWVLENENGEFSYPAMIRARDGRVHVLYTWNRRRLRHVVVDPRRLRGRPMPDGVWRGD